MGNKNNSQYINTLLDIQPQITTCIITLYSRTSRKQSPKMQRLSCCAYFTELSCCETCVRAQPVAIISKQVIFARVHYSLKHSRAGADPGYFLGGDPLISCSNSTPINHIVFFFFLQNTSCIETRRSPKGGGCAPPAPSP